MCLPNNVESLAAGINCITSAFSQSFNSRDATGAHYAVRKARMVTNGMVSTLVTEVVLVCEYLLCTNKIFCFEVFVLLSAFIQERLVAKDKSVLAGCICIHTCTFLKTNNSATASKLQSPKQCKFCSFTWHIEKVYLSDASQSLRIDTTSQH